MRCLPSVLLLVSACASPDDAPLTPDAAIAAIDGALPVDARLPLDAPPPPPGETCTSAGWCEVPASPSYVWAMSVTPAGQPWTVAYGAHAKASSGWTHHDVSWKDLVSPFIFHTELYTVHALSATDVWVGGRQGYVGHFDGATWRELRPAAPWPRGIYGASTNDVWVLYDSGLRYRWDGSTLDAEPTSQVRYLGAWGTSATSVWGFGETMEANAWRPAIDFFDGTAWTKTVLPGFGKVIAMWAASPDDQFALISLNGTTRLVRGSGTTWTTIEHPSVTQLFGIWGRSSTDVWAVGAQGRIVHFDGQTWTSSSSGTAKSLSKIHGTATTMWVTGDGVALRRP